MEIAHLRSWSMPYVSALSPPRSTSGGERPYWLAVGLSRDPSPAQTPPLPQIGCSHTRTHFLAESMAWQERKKDLDLGREGLCCLSFWKLAMNAQADLRLHIHKRYNAVLRRSLRQRRSETFSHLNKSKKDTNYFDSLPSRNSKSRLPENALPCAPWHGSRDFPN